MARTRTTAGIKKNAVGTRRAFIKGLERPLRTALDSLAYQSYTEVAAIPLERTENTNITMPSDSDGFNLVEMVTGFGRFQEFTFTFTEYRDEEGNFPWLESVQFNLPGSLVLADGRNRRLNDPYSFSSIVILDEFTITGYTEDDSANPSDGDVGNPNKLTATATSHGRNRHEITATNFLTETPGGTSAVNIVGVTSVRSKTARGADAIEWFAVGTGATSAKPVFVQRDELGNWGTAKEFGANNGQVKRLVEASGSLITLSPNAGHFHAPITDLTTATEVAHANADATASPVNSVWVKSGTEIWYTYGKEGVAAGRAHLAVANSPSAIPVNKFSETEPGTSVGHALLDIHGYNNQIVAVGGTGAKELAYIIKSADNGESWTEITTLPSGTKGLRSVFMVDENQLFVGTVDGKIYYSYNFGETWQARDIEGTPGSIDRIIFLWPDGAMQASELGYALGDDKLYVTISGGNQWVDRPSLVSGQIGSDFANDLAVAGAHKLMVAGNAGKVKINV